MQRRRHHLSLVLVLLTLLAAVDGYVCSQFATAPSQVTFEQDSGPGPWIAALNIAPSADDEDHPEIGSSGDDGEKVITPPRDASTGVAHPSYLTSLQKDDRRRASHRIASAGPRGPPQDQDRAIRPFVSSLRGRLLRTARQPTNVSSGSFRLPAGQTHTV